MSRPESFEKAPQGFLPLLLEHKITINEALLSDPPYTSEMTFTNLFMWRHHYTPLWREETGCLIVILQPKDSAPFGLPPFGPGDKKAALKALFQHLNALDSQANISRVGEDFIERFVDQDLYEIQPEPSQYDYVYLCQDLIKLSGRKLHQKKNHFNQFVKNYDFEIKPLNNTLIGRVLQMQESWCRLRECSLDPGLLSEDRAVYEALTHFGDLSYKGLAVSINGRIEAFALGEPLNQDTAVIHIEKANPNLRGLYVAVNRFFCQEFWSDCTYINREQDLGLEGLRRTKQSYHPHHLEKKYAVRPKAK